MLELKAVISHLNFSDLTDVLSFSRQFIYPIPSLFYSDAVRLIAISKVGIKFIVPFLVPVSVATVVFFGNHAQHQFTFPVEFGAHRSDAHSFVRIIHL